MLPRVYLDHNATAPLRAEARDAMLSWLERGGGNPSSVHAEGRAARAALEDAAVVFVSKSGSTAEVQVGLAHVRRACADRELELGPRAIAVTCEDSALDRLAQQEGWRGRLPMWSWVGGRTSIFSSAALLTAQFAGADVEGFLEGARLMDAETRRENPLENPAALLALAWPGRRVQRVQY